jgi:hypothetical protein
MLAEPNGTMLPGGASGGAFGASSLSQAPTSCPPLRAPGRHDGRLAPAASARYAIGPAGPLVRRTSECRVVVQLPAEAGQWGEAVVSYLRAVWEPGIAIVVADLTSVVSWQDGWLDGLAEAQRELAFSRAELRLVVWAADLYAALRQSMAFQLSVYANLEAALRTP